MVCSARNEPSGLSERLGVAFTCQSLEREDGCPVSRGGRFAHLAEESFPGFALQYPVPGRLQPESDTKLIDTR